jgi:hypothetical protein
MALHIRTGNQVADGDLNTSGLRDHLFNEEGKIISLCISSVMFPDEHGHLMLPYNALMEISLGLPQSLIRDEHQRTTLSYEHWGSDGLSHLGVFLEGFYAIAGYFGHDIHGPFDPEFRALYDDECLISKTLGAPHFELPSVDIPREGTMTASQY